MSAEPDEGSNRDDVNHSEKSMEQFVSDGFKIIINGTKASNKLPYGAARNIYEACPTFHRVMRAQGDAVLQQLSRLLRHVGCEGNIRNRDDEERTEMVVSTNDCIFDRVDFILDDIAGVRRNPDPEYLAHSSKPISGSWNERFLSIRPPQNVSTMLTASRTTEKPQLHFPDKVDNSRTTPFVPRINYKHNLLKPLALLFEDSDNIGQYSHPYEFEIEKFEPDETQLMKKPPRMYLPLGETPFQFVTTVDDIENMLKELRKADMIAVDVEHHSYRSFQGFTCLIQISTRQKDFLVDTLALRGDLQPLNEIFTNPKVLKVLHGSQMDIQWLQRDLSIYVVNMFDTHIAARYLSYPALSLAYLLDRFCNVKALKQFQLADWRIRPMPDEMIQYAREDTHYLLYICDMMRNALLEKSNGQDNLLRVVYAESKQLCLTRYVKPIWLPDDYLQLYHKSKRLLDNRQLFALRELYDWRDKTARECDESIGYVLPNHMLLHIAETLPREAQGILACCNPVPPLVRLNLIPLHLLIRKAQEQPLVRPIIDQAHQVDRAEVYGLSVDSPLRCPHDLAWLPEFRPDLPAILSNPVEFKENSELFCNKPQISVFENKLVSVEKRNTSAPLTPYQRYKLVKPYSDSLLQNEEKEEEEVKKKEPIPETHQPKIEIEEIVPLRNQLSKSTTKIKKINELKRKSNEPVEKIDEKKQKTRLFPNPYATPPLKSESKVDSTKPTKKNKKKKSKDGVKKFDYSTIDYKKFQSNPTEKVVHKPVHVKKKHKRTGKKNFKIAI